MRFKIILLLFLVFLVGFASTWFLYPKILTYGILNDITAGEWKLNRWYFTPLHSGKKATRGVIKRISPDIQYGFCLVDLTGGEIRLRISGWTNLQLLAFYDFNGSHLATHWLPDQKATEVRLNVAESPIGQDTSRVWSVPDVKGFVMLRRMLPGNKNDSSEDTCETL